MKKVLIIGANGFVGAHLANELINNKYECYGADLSYFKDNKMFKKTYVIDILDEKSIIDLLQEVHPEFIVNLAAISSVKLSWDRPALTFDVNVKGTINILEAVRKLGLVSRILFIGSSEQYGKIDYSEPVKEEVELKSINPYGISKISQEKIVKMYNEAYDIDSILVRAFNHIGPGQEKGFVIPDFASQIVDIEKGRTEPIISVGNLSVSRDFTDVRDIVNAYRLLLEKGISGEVYNVGSGIGISINDILNKLISISNVDIVVNVDKEKFRVVDTPMIVCDNRKLIKDTSWEQQYEIDKSLSDIMKYWRRK